MLPLIAFSTIKEKFQSPVSASLLACLFVFATTFSVSAQSAAPRPDHRWIGFWADAGWNQSGILDVTINNNTGSISGFISNGALKGTWQGWIQNNGIIVANYQYAGYPQIFLAQGVCRLNEKAQLVAYIQFIYQNQKFGEGSFTLAPAEFLLAASNLNQNSNKTGKNPFPSLGTAQGQYSVPNVNDYRDNPTGYIDALVPGYSNLVATALNDIQTFGNGSGASSSSSNGANAQLGYIESIVPSYNSIVKDALNDIKKYGGQGTTFNSNLNTINLTNKMMKDALTLNADEIERKYRGMNALNGGIAAQNQVYNSVQKNQQERQAKTAKSEAAMNDFKLQLEQEKAEWQLWQSQRK